MFRLFGKAHEYQQRFGRQFVARHARQHTTRRVVANLARRKRRAPDEAGALTSSRPIQLPRGLSRRLPDVATLVGYVGGPFDVWILGGSSTLLADVVRSVLAGALGQIFVLHQTFFSVPGWGPPWPPSRSTSPLPPFFPPSP